MAKAILTAERLRQLLDYDVSTGLFTHRRSHGRALKGTISGIRDSEGYVSISVDGKLYRGHRLAWLHVYGVWPTGRIDHINGNGVDNRLNNLRPATPSQNRANSKCPKNNQSGRKGVSFDKERGAWVAYIRVNKKNINLGRFATIDLAGAAYLRAAEKHFGEFARQG